MKACPFCAEQIDAAADTCPYCNSDLTRPLNTGHSGSGFQRKEGGSGSSMGTIVAIVVGVALFGMCVIGILAALLMPAVGQAREAARRSQCKSNLKQIALALHNYHDVYGSFPPAYVADEDGNPMHSWRVLILPFIEQQHLYTRYDFSEPWDSPVNSYVLDSMPALFRCPSEPAGPGMTTTAYAAVFGPNCVFRGSEPVKIREITDGTSNTLMVGEAHAAGIPWTSPQDIDVTLHAFLGDPDGFSSAHAGVVHFMTADGAVHAVSEATDQETLERLFQRDDGQPVGSF